MSRHSVLCRDSGARHCITTRPDAHTTGTRCHNKEGWAHMTEEPCRDKLHKVVKKKENRKKEDLRDNGAS